MMNCTTIDNSELNKVMPIKGLYIAGATLICIIQMIRDLVANFKSKQFWMPARCLSIDAASLTITGVAIKLSVDLNSPMPSQFDQLAKLATSAFLCIVLANIIPSLGRLKKGELQTNTIALAILIISSTGSLCMQLKIEVIYAFRIAHIFMILMMFVLLLMCIHVATLLPAIKQVLQLGFDKLHSEALETFSFSVRGYLMKFSLLAQSSCPHYLLSRSLVSMVMAACGLMPALALFFVIYATITHKNKRVIDLRTCNGESNYEWTVLAILITQTIAVIIGLVSLLSRMIYILNVKRAGHTSPKWNERRGASRALFRFMFFHVPEIVMDAHDHFLHSKSERRSINFLVESSSHVAQKYINAESPEYLIELLNNYLSRDFGGVVSFDRDEYVPSILNSDRDHYPSLISSFIGAPPNSWALPVLTMTCIATALPNIDKNSKDWLRKSVTEGLKYVKLVENNLNDIHDLFNTRAAANLVWSGLHGQRKWFVGNLEFLALKSSCPTEVLLSLAKLARRSLPKVFNDPEKLQKYDIETQSEFTNEALAAHSMYKICATILIDCQGNHNLSSDEIFKKLCITIADVLGACFTNLRQCILLECKRSTIEKRRETSFRMLRVFGETERVVKILEEEGRKIPDLSDDKLAFIDEWRSHLTHHRTEEQSGIESDHLDIV